MLPTQEHVTSRHSNALVIDANSDTRGVIITTLRMLGITRIDVAVTKDGALQHVARHAEDEAHYSLAIIVGENQMILDTLAAFAGQLSLPCIDVIAICNDTSGKFIRELARYGVSGCLKLPFSIAQLQDRILCDYHIAALERMPAFEILP